MTVWDLALFVILYGGFAGFLIWTATCALLRPQDLAKKYNAKWAVVTGGSSGIGLAIAERLAEQGVSVVIVAVGDAVLEKAVTSLAQRFPLVGIRACPVNLAAPVETYMGGVTSATADIPVGLVFCNAGFMIPGLVLGTRIEAHQSQVQCNVVASLSVAHHFADKMMADGRPGLIAFTSSASAFFPGPTAATYAASKAFVTSFATSLAAEMRGTGVDVVVTHPSPIRSSFWANCDADAQNLQSLSLVQRLAAPPSAVVDRLFACAGRCVFADQGFLTFGFRLAHRVLDAALLAELMALASRATPDMRSLWRKHRTSSP